MTFIDLSVPLTEKTPVYPGDPVTKIEQAGVLETSGYEDHYVSVGTHVGTHIDAPAHMIKGGKTLNQVELDRFIGRGVYIKVDKEITLDKVKTVDIGDGDIVLFHTGMSDVYHQKEYYDNYPAISETVANYLVSKRVKMVGVDMCSVDHEPFPVHKIFLGNGALIIENLTNLSQLDGKKFKVYALPISLQIDGAPARVIAELS